MSKIDIEEMCRWANSKSHKPEEIADAIEAGDEIWSFNSGTSGNDDLLIYPRGTAEEKIREDLLAHFELGEADPFDSSINPWSLELLSREEMAARWPLELEDE